MSDIVAELRTPCQWCGLTRCEACRRLDEQAADEIEKWQRKYSAVLTFMDDVRNTARNRNPHGCTILDFMAVWNDQYQARLNRLEAENEQLLGDLNEARRSLKATSERTEELGRELDEYKMEMRDLE